MSRATYPLKLPTSIKTAAARLATENGVSLNQWIAAAFFKQRAERARPDDLKEIMRRVPDAPIDPDDAIPPGLAKRLSRSE
jgi:hypothetical protein